MNLTIFEDVSAQHLQNMPCDFDELAGILRDTDTFPSKADCPLIKLAKFGDMRTEKGSLRHDSNVIEVDGIEGDYDGEKVTLAEAQMLVHEHNISAIFYTSPSHSEAKPRWRVLCQLSRPYPPNDRAKFVARLNGVLGGILTPESFVLSQSYYAGKVEGAPYVVAQVSGACIDTLDALDAKAIKPEKNGESRAERLDKLHSDNWVDEDAYYSGAAEAADEASNVPHDVDVEENWPDPQPLSATHESRPYPLEALPPAIRHAVKEAVAFAQCPDSLAACSALSVLSLAGQGLVDVERAPGLSGPTSLYLLAIAESGERKTTVDTMLKKPIEAWETRKQLEVGPAMADKRAELASWEAKKEATLLGIKVARKGNKPTGALDHDLRELEKNKPIPERWPQILYAETTPEALAWDLSKPSGWPSAGMIQSEAGIVFGSHGMGKESIMRNLALLNALWDGASHNVNRRTSESFKVSGVRLTMGLAAQPEVIRDFMENAKVARGIGFVARFLIAWPESNIGNRAYKQVTPDLSQFHARIDELLSVPFRIDDRGRLEPTMLRFAPAAQAVWIEFHNDVEAELRPGGQLADLKDVASKAADNAARLAALFHLYAHGPQGAIGADSTTAACQVVKWHLDEALRFLGELAVPRVTSDAIRLSEWIGQYCRGEAAASNGTTGTLHQRTAQIHGPIRDGDRFQKSLAELEEAGHVRRLKEGRKKLLQVNPGLWEE